MDQRYIITTGFFCGKNWRNTGSQAEANRICAFFDIWLKNTTMFARPVDIITIAAPSDQLPAPELRKGQWLYLQHNLGHAHDLDSMDISPKFCGWSAAYILGAMTAYANNCDYIFKEQDCLAFGPWVDLMYRTLDETGCEMLVGRENVMGMRLEQSLTIIKHSFILEFVKLFLEWPGSDGGKGKYKRPEIKFAEIMDYSMGKIGHLPFGYGRTRPSFGIDTRKPFYLQQITPQELEILRNGKLV